MDYEKSRRQMVARQLKSRDIRDERVLTAMEMVPRHLFVPAAWQRQAYDDTPLPLGHEQTISQPYIVAFMCQEARLAHGDRVLELGTGSGYQAAILAEMGMEVYSLEIDPGLSGRARRDLDRAGYPDVQLRAGDGYGGWPEAAPFQAILLTAAPLDVPPPLKEQLADGGCIIAPLGSHTQDLVRLTREGDELRRESLLAVRFVPMRGKVERSEDGD